MDNTEREQARQRLAQLRDEVARLEKDLGENTSHWQADDYYGAYHATNGFILGIVGAAASLIFNVLGSLAIGQNALRLIQVYLTFPLGEKALSADFSTGMILAIGCCLYLGTGMILGIPFQMVIARVLPRGGTLSQRLVVATVLGLLLWAVNFYAILAWLQPMLVDGGNWITDPKILPPWVGAATHLVFAWTMALVFPWGRYVPYRRQTEAVTTS